jgi:uncharacterized membrane protein YczE
MKPTSTLSASWRNRSPLSLGAVSTFLGALMLLMVDATLIAVTGKHRRRPGSSIVDLAM